MIIRLFPLLFFITSFYGSANTTKDSLIAFLSTKQPDTVTTDQLVSKSKYYSKHGKFDSALTYAQFALKIAGSQEELIAKAKNAIGLVHYDMGKYKQSIPYFKNALNISQTTNNHLTASKHLSNIGAAHLRMSNFDNALNYFSKGLTTAKEINNEIEIVKHLNELGLVYWNLGNLEKASSYFFEGLELAQKVNDTPTECNILHNIGNLHFDQKDYKKALTYYQQSLSFKKDNQNAQTYINIGNVYSTTNDYEKAIHNYLLALEQSEQINSKRLIAYALLNLGITYRRKENFDTALTYARQSLELFQQIKSSKNIAVALSCLGDIHIGMEKYHEAERFLLQAIAISDSLGEIREKLYFKNSLYRTYKKLANHKKALETYEEAMAIKDSITGEEQSRILTQKELNFKFEKKEALEIAQREKAVLVAKAKEKKRMLIFTSVSLLLISWIIVITLLFRQQKIKRKNEVQFYEDQKKITQQENELLKTKNKLAKEELNYSKHLLENYTEQILQKNKLIDQIQEEIETIKKEDQEESNSKYQKIETLINTKILTEEDWNGFQKLFNQVHKGFYTRLREKLPNLTNSEIRLISLLKLKLDTKSIATILGVSTNTIKTSRYRLKQKLDLTPNQSIEDLISSI